MVFLFNRRPNPFTDGKSFDANILFFSYFFEKCSSKQKNVRAFMICWSLSWVFFCTFNFMYVVWFMFYICLSVISTIQHSTSVAKYLNAKWMKRSMSNYRSICTFSSIFLLSLFNVQVKESELAQKFPSFCCVQLSFCIWKAWRWAKEMSVSERNCCDFSKYSQSIFIKRLHGLHVFQIFSQYYCVHR